MLTVKYLDINYLSKKENIDLLKKLGWDGQVFVQDCNTFSKDKFEEVKAYEDSRFKIYSGIVIKEKSTKEVVKKVKKYRSKVDIIIVDGGDDKINRIAVEMHDVDILSNPEYLRKDTGLDHILCRLGSAHRVAIGLNFNNILMAKNQYRVSKILWAYHRNLKLCKKYDTPSVIYSFAKDIYSVKSPMDLRHFLKTITEDDIYSKKIMETTLKIAEYRRELKDKSTVRYGIKIIKKEN